jgi:hypothetical protein
VSGEDRSSATVSVHASGDAYVVCHAYERTAPILVIGTGSASVTLSIQGREDIHPSAVTFARSLARNAERFAAECERLQSLHALIRGHNPAQEPAQHAAGESR